MWCSTGMTEARYSWVLDLCALPEWACFVASCGQWFSASGDDRDYDNVYIWLQLVRVQDSKFEVVFLCPCHQAKLSPQSASLLGIWSPLVAPRT